MGTKLFHRERSVVRGAGVRERSVGNFFRERLVRWRAAILERSIECSSSSSSSICSRARRQGVLARGDERALSAPEQAHRLSVWPCRDLDCRAGDARPHFQYQRRVCDCSGGLSPQRAFRREVSFGHSSGRKQYRLFSRALFRIGLPIASDTLAEWLRRRPAKPMGSPRAGSNPTVVGSCGSGVAALQWRQREGCSGNWARDLAPETRGMPPDQTAKRIPEQPVRRIGPNIP